MVQDNKRENQQSEHTNIELIYTYTKYIIELTKESVDALNTKLSTILAFSVTSIIVAINLPNQAFIDTNNSYKCYSCLILKIIVCVFLALTIYLSVKGFRAKSVGGMTPPKLLLNENYYDSDEDCRLIITKTWIEALEELESLRDDKATILNKAIVTLCIAALFAISSVILASALSIF